jgi:hypothetical protein
MPEALALIIPALIGAGTSIYSAVNQPGAPKPATPTPAQQKTTALNTRQTQENAISQQLPGLQAQVGGALSPEALLKLAISKAGIAGESGIGASMQDMIMKMLSGNNSTVTAGGINTGTGSTTGLTGGTYA